MSHLQHAALQLFDDFLLAEEPVDITATWGAPAPLIVDIGFGDGKATLALAQAHTNAAILAIDVHTPGVADLLRELAAQNITNVRVMHADAVHVMEQLIPLRSVHAVRTLFPDPWPKTRHHKRRMVQPSIVDLFTDRIEIGGTWHLASDWMPYVDAMMGVFGADLRWNGGIVPRPDRPITHYEARALREGRQVIDLMMTRVS
jgi:tRNA (guanine-N7-)-methyltransferase